LFSQNARILQLDNSNAYQLIERFIESGRFTNLNPTKLPYTHSEVYFELERLNYDALSEIEKVWYNLLKEEILYSDEKRSKEYNFEPYILLASDFNNSERKNVYRPTSNDYYVWPFGETGFITDYKGFTINTNVYFDLYYEFAPDGLDPTNRLYIRNEDSYVGYSSKHFKAYLGRFEHNWGLQGKKATFVSGNKPTFDKFTYTIGTEKISFTVLHGFLDNISGDDVYRGSTAGDPLAKRRYLSLKRLDWKVSDYFSIALKEAILYSGSNVNPEPKYLVPSFVFFFLEAATPKDQVENLLLGTNLWFNKDGFTVNIDFMLDDLIFNRVERGITERSNFSAILNSSYQFKRKPLAINWDFELISYQSYNTDQAEGRYIYLDRGIATDFNDYVFTEIGLEYYADLKVKGLLLSPYIGMLKQGEQIINQTFDSAYPNGDPFENVLTGTVETTTRFGLKSFYSPAHYFWLKMDIGYNRVDNFRNIEGRSSNRIVGMFEAGFKYQL
tara:strand:- start:5009 stop:6508 length:1500 start_codon:yes stop_codon:yes gene_type:complete